MAAASARLVSSQGMSLFSNVTSAEDSSDSDGETEPAKNFFRRISTNKEIKTSVSMFMNTIWHLICSESVLVSAWLPCSFNSGGCLENT